MRPFIRIIGLIAALCATTMGWPAAAEDGLRIELVDVTAPEVTEHGMTVEEGKIAFNAKFGVIEFTWSAIPKVIGPEGFRVTLTVHGRLESKAGDTRTTPMATTFWGSGFTTLPDLAQAEIELGAGQDLTKTQDVQVIPEPGLKDGDIFEFNVGSSLGPTYRYRYRVGTGAPPAGGQITAELVDCPSSIVISELPGVSCHLRISGFRRNTADPVQVILPSSMDLTGNHGNGLQVLNTAGALDVARMDDPYLWLVSLFACPGQKGAGVNCHGTGAVPGLLSVPIVVRQEGTGETQVMLSVTAVAGKNSVLGKGAGSGTAVTSTSVAAGPGQIGARIDCPGTIYISAIPGLNCQVIITGWLKDTQAPVRVLLTGTIDEFGTHANGMQVMGSGEEDHFEWDNDQSHSWGLSVFACPGQNTTGANCYESVTTPGVQAVPVLVEQDGLAPANITLMIDAQPHP